MTDARVTQVAVEVIVRPTTISARATLVVVEVVLRPPTYIAGTIPGSSTVTGNIVVRRRLAGHTIAGSSVVSGSLYEPGYAFFSAAFDFNAYDAEPGTRGAAHGASIVSGILTINRALLGSSAGTSTGEGMLDHIALEGLSFYGDGYDPEGEETTEEPWAFGILTGHQRLVGLAAGVATAAAMMETDFKLIRGLAVNTSTAVGKLTRDRPLFASAAGRATAQAVLTGVWALHGIAECSSFALGQWMILHEEDWGEFPPPNVPPERVVYIRYRGIDITRRVLYQGTKFRTSARGTPGTCIIRLRDDVTSSTSSRVVRSRSTWVTSGSGAASSAPSSAATSSRAATTLPARSCATSN